MDRPGFGRSTPKPDRSILDWVDDRDELTEHLELTSFLCWRARVTAPMRWRSPPPTPKESVVTGPTAIWQGGLDDVHTAAICHYLADHIPHTHLIYEPDYATFNFIDHFDTILDTLTGRP